MKYEEITFTLTPCSQDACDLLAALAAEAGLEAFEETSDGLKGYAQRQLFSPETLDDVVKEFPMPGVHILYKVREAEDKDWNAKWEEEGFEPIVIGQRLVIHDGRHTGGLETADYEQSVEIDARLAFGTGTHETTRMVCGVLLETELSGKALLDCGCGTGILAISALKLGAGRCTGYDIDEWSVDNTRHNAIINRVDDRLSVMHGDATLLDATEERFDVVVANINRNILLADMARFVSVMKRPARLILSGFYESDCPLLEQRAAELGLTVMERRHDGDWACLVMDYS